MVVSAPSLGNILSKYGRKNILITGCICEALAMLIFAPFYHIDDPKTFQFMSFIGRVVMGFGNACILSSSTSIISFNFADDMTNLIGLTLAFTGLGMLCGPLIGAFLYWLGGCTLPLYVTAITLLILTVPICFGLEKDSVKRDIKETN